jgi:regulator of replication initiation timing
MKRNSELLISPQSKKKMANDAKALNNLTQDCAYAFLPNGSIINLGEWLKYSFTTGIAYAISSYTTLGLLKSSSTPIFDEIEVTTMTEQLEQLSQDLRDLNKKFDSKVDNLDKKLDLNFDKLDKKIDSKVDKLDLKFDKLEVKIEKILDKLTATNIVVAGIQATTTTNNTWKERFQIPLFVGLTVGLVVVIATAVLRVFIP